MRLAPKIEDSQAEPPSRARVSVSQYALKLGAPGLFVAIFRDKPCIASKFDDGSSRGYVANDHLHAPQAVLLEVERT